MKRNALQELESLREAGEVSGWVLNCGPKEGGGHFTVWGPKLSDDTYVFLTLNSCIEGDILEAIETVKVKGLRSIPTEKSKGDSMLDILEREDSCVRWRYNDRFDGCSWLVDGQVDNSELCDCDFILTAACRARIAQAVKDWLDETGEGEKWIEENY